METELKDMNKNLLKLMEDMQLIKNILLSEGELSDYAKKELAEARKVPESELISQEEVMEKILEK